MSKRRSGRAIGSASAAVIERLESRWLLSTFTVTNTNDSGAGSLRQAITSADNTPTSISTIAFNISGTGVHTIAPLSVLPAISAPVIIDGSTQPGFNGVPLIELSGASAGTADGLDIIASGSTVKDLIVSNFNGQGISIYNGGQNNIIENNYIGTDPTGAIAAGNTYTGISISGGADGNQVLNNLISANGSANNFPGIQVFGTGTDANFISGNKIGTDITGTLALGNGGAGIIISDGAQSNRVGTNGDGVNDAAERNIISANGSANNLNYPGVNIDGSGTNQNIVAGNDIGTDATGAKPLGNAGVGVLITGGAAANRIGVSAADADAAGERNVISANGTTNNFPGVQLDGSGTNGNIVAGNYIGTDVTGTQALGNGGDGVLVSGGAQSNRVGTNGDGVGDAIERNIISGNGIANNFPGIQIDGIGTNANIVAGNFVGTDVTGANAMGNGGTGVIISGGAESNRIGVNGSDADAAAERNIISANGLTNHFSGIDIFSTGTAQNIVAGNYIGTDVTGLLPLGNGAGGITITDGASGNLIGTNGDGIGDQLERNVIADNLYQGIYISDPGTMNNVVAGNHIGANAAGSPLGNFANGIWINNGAQDNRIGTNGTDVDAAGEGNLIIANSFSGIVVVDPTSGGHTTGNSIRGNSIYDNGGLAIDLNADGFNANHGNLLEAGPNNFQNHPQLLSGTPGASTVVNGTLTALAGTVYTLDFYANSAAENPFAGTGVRWLGSISVTTNSSGSASFSAQVGTASAGEWITSTATDPGGNTSEFSSPIELPTVQQTINGLTWTPIGPAPINETQGNSPMVNGRVSVAAVDPTNPNVVYIGADGGGVWKTTDWLDPIPHWTPLTDNQPSLEFGNISYTALAVAPSNPQTIYAAVSVPGGGILKSTNGGATWTELANSTFNYAQFASLVVDPTNANHLYVSIWYGATSGGGVYQSTDGGQTWGNLTASIHNGSAADLVIDPANPAILYVGLVGSTFNGGASNGIYKTTNGGTSWTQLNNGVLSGNAVGVSIRLAISPSSPNVLYATVFDPALGNAPDGEPHRYTTVNGGSSWTPLGDLTAIGPEDRYWHTVLSVDPTNPNIVYINGDHELFYSTDAGMTWNHLYDEDPVNVEFDDSGAVIMTGDRGIYRWTGGSASFENKQGDLQNAELYTITLDPTNPSVVYGIAQDQTSSMKYDGSTVWNYTGGGDEVGKIVVDPTNPNVIYEYDPNNTGSADGGGDDFSNSSSPAPSFILKSIDGGANFSLSGTGIPTTEAGFGLAYTAQQAFEMDPSNHNRLLVGTDTVYESTDDASSWHAISPVLSPGQFLTDLASAPSSPNTVYASTADGKMFVTTNDSTWSEMDAGLPLSPFNRMMDIQIDPANALHSYVVTGDFLGGDSGNDHVFVTTNGGATWTNITGNLPNDDSGQAIAVDWRFSTPRLYVGTLRGVFVSADSGAHWNIVAGLPNVDVTDLQIAPQFNILAAATYGRGVFEIRIPTPLALLGDTNEDGVVNFADLVTLAQHYGKSGQTWATGDFNGDGVVDFPDLVILAQHYNQSGTASVAASISAASQVPGSSQTDGLKNKHTGGKRSHRSHELAVKVASKTDVRFTE